jgi:peptidoglycan/LPS O-acetylase OafA/YrhL
LKWFSDYGWVGVDIFFVMSGYLITTLLLKELSHTEKINLKKFWFHRMLRLWPSWIFALALSISLVAFLSRSQDYLHLELSTKWWHYFLHFGNYSSALYGKIHTLFSHYWSLAIEEHFYILWPLLLAFIKNKKQLFVTVSILIVMTVVFRFHHVMNNDNILFIRFSTHTRLDGLLFGCLLAFYLPALKELTLIKELLLTTLMIGLYWIGLKNCVQDNGSNFLNALSYSLIALATCALIIIALRGHRHGFRFFLSKKFTARLGVLSYGVYLIHLHVSYLVFPFFKRFPLITSENGLALINFILPFFPAYFMYFYLDRFFARYKNQTITLPVSLVTSVGQAKNEVR